MSHKGDMSISFADNAIGRPLFGMLVGVPGSGKSTWLTNNNYHTMPNVMILFTDAYIETVAANEGKTYTEVFRDVIKQAEMHLYSCLNTAVQNRMHIIWDQTNLTRKTRMNKLKHIPNDYYKVALVFPTPEPKTHTAWLNSDARAGKVIPEPIMYSMIENFEHPTLWEGFNSIRTVNK